MGISNYQICGLLFVERWPHVAPQVGIIATVHETVLEDSRAFSFCVAFLKHSGKRACADLSTLGQVSLLVSLWEHSSSLGWECDPVTGRPLQPGSMGAPAGSPSLTGTRIPPLQIHPAQALQNIWVSSYWPLPKGCTPACD